MREPSQGEPLADGPIRDFKALASWAVLFVHSFAKVIHPFTRVPTSFGIHYFDFQALIGWVLFSLLVSCLPPGPGEPAVLIVYYLIPVMFLTCRFFSAVRRSRGLVVHTKYCGDSLLNVVCPFLGRDFARSYGECLLCFLVGLAILSLCPKLAVVSFVGGFAVLISHSAIVERDRKKVEMMTDHALESQTIAEQFRARYGR